MNWTIKFGGYEIPVEVEDFVEGPVVVLAHGAGSHMGQKTLVWLTKLVTESGGRVVRFNFLYRVKGGSMPDRMPTLVETYRQVIESVRSQLQPSRLVIGGHSMGGRVASMLEAESKIADGLLLFGYPLHPPKQPEKIRDAHLPNIHVPTLQINGTEDEFCDRALMTEVRSRLDPDRWQTMWIEAADHSYAVKKISGRSRTDVESEIVETLTPWLANL